MDVYVARQPIFDRNMNVFGYELLYRGIMNFDEGTDDNKATAELVSNAFLTMHIHELTDETKAFINFSQKTLIEEIPLLLPADSVVVEVLENVEINENVIEACRKLREKGYIIALGDFVISKDSYLPLMEIAHIVKIEFSAVNFLKQRELMKQYKNKIKFLADKVETREEYQLAMDMGYDYFQGYFFSKPVIIKGKEIESLNINLIKTMSLLNNNEPDYQQIAEIIETDLGLSYKLLKLANSAFFGSKNKITTIKQALVQLGILEIRKWIYVMMLKDIQIIENKELIKTCFIRAKFMELLAIETGKNDKGLEYFMTGMFSAIDVLLNKDMKIIVDEISLTDDVKEALLGGNNEIKKVLDMVINYELLQWNKTAIGITKEKFMSLYIKALMWIRKLSY